MEKGLFFQWKIRIEKKDLFPQLICLSSLIFPFFFSYGKPKIGAFHLPLVKYNQEKLENKLWPWSDGENWYKYRFTAQVLFFPSSFFLLPLFLISIFCRNISLVTLTLSHMLTKSTKFPSFFFFFFLLTKKSSIIGSSEFLFYFSLF